MMKIILRLSYVLLPIVLLLQACKKSDNPTNPEPPKIPGCATNLLPAANGVVGTGSTITLTWGAASGANSYDVYLGTTPTPTTLIGSNVTNNTMLYTVPATKDVTYYWYVVPKNANGSATGCTSNITSFTSAVIQAPPALGFLVVGYFPSYRNIADVPDIKFRMCNVVNYAFFSVNSSGLLTENNSALVPLVITKAKTNGAKVMLSINEAAAGNFRNMASSATGRTSFAKDIMNRVRQYGFDGVDIDWEYPTTADGSDITYTALMKELSDSLHRDSKYYLTAAITPGKYAGGIRDAIKSEVFAYADWFNIMAYDDFSTSTLYKHHSDFTLASTSLNYWINTRGMPREKAVLGFPAYGRPSGLTQTGTVLTYKDILAKGGSSQSDSAIVSNGAYTNYMIYYNGQPTVKKKAMLAKQQGNGIMMWEKWQDAMDNNSLLKAACDTLGRPY